MRPLNLSTTALSIAVTLILGGCSITRPGPKPTPIPTAPPHSIRAEGAIEIRRSDSAMRARARVLAAAPSSFRMDVLGPLGQNLFVVIGNGGSFSTLSGAGSQTYEAGDPLYPYPFTPGELVGLLLGTGAAGVGEEGERTVVLGAKGAKATIKESETVSGHIVPKGLTIEGGAAVISLEFKRLEVNPALDDGVFNVPGADN